MKNKWVTNEWKSCWLSGKKDYQQMYETHRVVRLENSIGIDRDDFAKDLLNLYFIIMKVIPLYFVY